MGHPSRRPAMRMPADVASCHEWASGCRDLSNSEDVIFDCDAALYRYHLADGLNLIKPGIFCRCGHEAWRGDEVTVALGSDGFALLKTLLGLFRRRGDAAV